MAGEKSIWDVLGVRSGASDLEIKQAWDSVRLGRLASVAGAGAGGGGGEGSGEGLGAEREEKELHESD